MKSYTDLEQSKKLAKILPLESADMYYCCGMDVVTKDWSFDSTPTIINTDNQIDIGDIPCWSLSALLSVLPPIEGFRPIIDLDINLVRYEGNYRDKLCFSGNNLIDVCVEMIIKLKELNLL